MQKFELILSLEQSHARSEFHCKMELVFDHQDELLIFILGLKTLKERHRVPSLTLVIFSKPKE